MKLTEWDLWSICKNNGEYVISYNRWNDARKFKMNRFSGLLISLPILSLVYSISSLSFFYWSSISMSFVWVLSSLSVRHFSLGPFTLRSCPSWFSSWTFCKYHNEFMWREMFVIRHFPVRPSILCDHSTHLTLPILHLLSLLILPWDFKLRGFEFRGIWSSSF